MNKIQNTITEMIFKLMDDYPDLNKSIHNKLFHSLEANAIDFNFINTVYQDILKKSKSQFRQDLFVLHELNYKRNGYFVDFGATDGYDINNSYLLETEYDWNGICAEPAKIWHSALKTNRKAHIETKCIYKVSGDILNFNQTINPDMSTINEFSNNDYVAKLRENGSLYLVETISLMDLLAKYDSPQNIDYLSIDTEGSEYDILSSFDFNKYNIKIITCEHNYTPMREVIYDFLTSKGYVRKFENISLYDDWYVKQ